MQTQDFNFFLPEDLIAQKPIEPRDHSRLMVLNKENTLIEHKYFYDIIDELMPGDCLILNDSRVLPARIFGKKKETGANLEFLLLSPQQQDVWEVLAKPGKKAKIGDEFIFNDGLLKAKVLANGDDATKILKFFYKGNFYNILEEIGQMPLPPYIKEKLENKERYQTVYSKELGSAAAPTAGLHFTKDILEKIKQKGINIGFITLHVGLGTFRPVKVDNITEHKMHSEHYEISEQTAELINKTKQKGGRIIAVGTTACRTLEAMFKKENKIIKSEGFTDIFIFPGYKFKVIDGLLTNFHLPESTLLMLVAALYGHKNIMAAYKTAIENNYRFFSFGDAMLIL